MKILQIAVGMTASKVYYSLFSALSKKEEISFSVYAPLHKNKLLEEIDYPFHIYSNQIIKSYDKYVYYTKIKRMFRDIKNNFDISEYSLIHAHSLFSDGAVAYELYKKFNIPYIVAVRNYDVNKYYKYAFHLRKYANEILLNANKVIFISPSYKDNVINNHVPKISRENVAKKVQVIPNGIDDFWINNKENEHKQLNQKTRLIFVGRIDENKNLETLLKSVSKLIGEQYSCSLDIVGDGPLRENLQNKYSKITDINFHGPIRNKESLKLLYNKSDILVVPSLTETFGLVYLEAMSCGVPVIYTKNQGFDGQFPEGLVGYHINPKDTDDIILKIKYITKDYERISKNCLELIESYRWSNVAEEYIKLYKANYTKSNKLR